MLFPVVTNSLPVAASCLPATGVRHPPMTLVAPEEADLALVTVMAKALTGAGTAIEKTNVADLMIQPVSFPSICLGMGIWEP